MKPPPRLPHHSPCRSPPALVSGTKSDRCVSTKDRSAEIEDQPYGVIVRLGRPLTRELNSAALCVLLPLGRRRHQARNHCHHTLGIAVHRLCLFRRLHHRCSLDRFSCVRLMGMLPHRCDYIRWCFAHVAVASAIGPKRTSLVAPHMSAFGGKADMRYFTAYVCF